MDLSFTLAGLHSVIPKKFFPLAGRPEGPRDRTGEMPKKSGMTNIASMVVNEPNPVLTDDDLAGENVFGACHVQTCLFNLSRYFVTYIPMDRWWVELFSIIP